MSEMENLQQADGNKENKENRTSGKPNEEPLHKSTDIEFIEEDTTDVAEATKKSSGQNEVIEQKNYQNMDLDQLVTEMSKLLKNHSVHKISKHINAIKTEFNSKFKNLHKEKRNKFIKSGGNEIDFYFTNDAKKLFNTLNREYKKARNNYYEERNKRQKENLAERLLIIEEIKDLLNTTEPLNVTYKKFKALQEKWKNGGPIPKDKYNNTWQTYHHHVERFYDYLHLNNEFREIDYKHNLEKKLVLIERAEALVKKDNIKSVFKELQLLHKLWKEELGPVAKEHRDSIWERFSNATKAIHEKRKLYFEALDKKYEKNLEIKETIILEIETIANKTYNTHSQWQEIIKTVEQLRQKFFNAGKVPFKDNETTWLKFNEAVRNFNRNKNKFYKSLKKDQHQNLQQKIELIKIAEAHKNSDDFDTATPIMKKIQQQWKQIGHVPKAESNKIWKQFKDACNHYFDRLHKNLKKENSPLYEALDKKTELLNTLKNFNFTKNAEADFIQIKDLTDKWRAIGAVPEHKKYLNNKFISAVDAAFNKISANPAEADLIKFNLKIETIINSKNSGLLDNELNYVRKKIDDLKAEITQLENNLQFFSNIETDNPLVKDVMNNINKHKDNLKLWEIKHNIIKEKYT